MQDKMAAPNKVTDTRTELAELIKKRAEIAVSCREAVDFFAYDQLMCVTVELFIAYSR